MSSFLDDENQMLIDSELQEIAEHLLQEWINSNLDEGQLYSDYQIASMCNSDYLKDKFNKFYNLNPDDQYYLEVE